jgi:ADP-ribose pyrophosphatase
MALARLDFYECGFGYHRAPGQVEGPDGPATAQVYWPDGSLPLSGKAWHLAEWQAADGGLSVDVAREWMAQFGQIRATDVAWRYPQMRRRAHTRRMAAEHVPPRGPGTALGRADLKDHQRREVWGGFFTIEEHDLAVPLLEGGPPRPMRRAVFVSSDAAIVLPYDPARDRVLLIEQFRAGPLARNDPAPWILEPVAGLVDPGETPEETAFRETAEEAGVTPRELIEIARYYPSPGASTEYFHSYLGLCDLPDGVEGHHGVEDEGEDIRTHLMSFDAAMAAVAAGTISHRPADPGAALAGGPARRPARVCLSPGSGLPITAPARPRRHR